MLAILSKEIKFLNFDKVWVVLKEDTEVWIDPEENIAFCEGYHFDIEQHEYIVIN